MCITGGIGGGGILVPLFIIVLQFEPKHAIPLSNVTILVSIIPCCDIDFQEYPEKGWPRLLKSLRYLLCLSMNPHARAGWRNRQHDVCRHGSTPQSKQAAVGLESHLGTFEHKPVLVLVRLLYRRVRVLTKVRNRFVVAFVAVYR
jgi:hypothetical protein